MKYIVVYDVETTGLDVPYIGGGTSEIIQIGAVALNYNTLAKESEFSTMLGVANPAVLDDPEIQKALKVNGKTKEEIVGAPSASVGWQHFVAWMTPYGGGASNNKNRPIPAGQNIMGFDNFFTKKMCEKYGPWDKKKGQKLFSRRINLDTTALWPFWFTDEVKEYSMDNLREFFGMSKEGGHDALKDAQDSAWIVARFLNFHRRIGTTKFKGAFKGENPFA